MAKTPKPLAIRQTGKQADETPATPKTSAVVSFKSKTARIHRFSIPDAGDPAGVAIRLWNAYRYQRSKDVLLATAFRRTSQDATKLRSGQGRRHVHEYVIDASGTLFGYERQAGQMVLEIHGDAETWARQMIQHHGHRMADPRLCRSEAKIRRLARRKGVLLPEVS